jgi:hypothetical protein
MLLLVRHRGPLDVETWVAQHGSADHSETLVEADDPNDVERLRGQPNVVAVEPAPRGFFADDRGGGMVVEPHGTWVVVSHNPSTCPQPGCDHQRARGG